MKQLFQNLILKYLFSTSEYTTINDFEELIDESCNKLNVQSNVSLQQFLDCAYSKINKYFFDNILNVKGIAKDSELGLPSDNVGLMNHLYLKNVDISIITFKSYEDIQHDYNELLKTHIKLYAKGYIKNISFIFKSFNYFCLFLLQHECVHNLLQYNINIGHSTDFWKIFENYSGENPFAYLGYHVCLKIDEYVHGDQTFKDIFNRGEFTSQTSKDVFVEAFEEAWGDYIPVASHEYIRGRILAYFDTIANFGTVNI